MDNTTAVSIPLALTTGFQTLTSLINQAGFTDILNMPEFSVPVTVLNNSLTIDIYFATGYESQPSGAIGVISPQRSVPFVAGLNSNLAWVKAASGSPTVTLWIGVADIPDVLLTGVAGVDVSQNVLAKGTSGGDLTDSRITDTGTTGQWAAPFNVISLGDPNGDGNNTIFAIDDAQGEVTSSVTFTAPGVLATGTSLGFTTGGAITQATSKSTPVTLNKGCGAVTMNAANLTNNTTASFTVNNTSAGAHDNIIVNHTSAGTSGAYQVWASSLANNSFSINVRNISGGALAEAIVISFSIIKGAIS